jgi:hypothetical protein
LLVEIRMAIQGVFLNHTINCDVSPQECHPHQECVLSEQPCLPSTSDSRLDWKQWTFGQLSVNFVAKLESKMDLAIVVCTLRSNTHRKDFLGHSKVLPMHKKSCRASE